MLGVLITLPVFVTSMSVLRKIQVVEQRRRREERLIEWIRKDLPPLP